MESNAIRLTNRTAIALRRQAKRTRNAYFVMGAVGTLLLLAGVLTGVLDKALGWVYSGVMDQIGALFTWLFELIKLM